MKVNVSALPAALRERGLFCPWRFEERDGRRTKVPYNSHDPQRRGDSTDRSKFAPLEEVLPLLDNFDGIGVGVFDDLAAIDVDHCVDDAGNLSNLASDILELTAPCYAEKSPSGHGLRILCLAPSMQYDRDRFFINNRRIGVEVYVAGITQKFVTVTGDVIRSGELVDGTEQLQQLLDKYMLRPDDKTTESTQSTPVPLDLSDEELIERASNASNGSKFAALWAGDTSDYAGDDSAADLALCNLLAFWTGRAPDRMDRIFRRSGLMRDKWDSRRGGKTYGQLTIEKAIRNCGDVYHPPDPGKAYSRSPQGQDDGQEDPRASLHRFKTGKGGEAYAVDIIDDAMAEAVTRLYQMFIIGGRFYVYRDGVYRRDDNGSLIRSLIADLMYDELRSDARITRVYRLLLSKHRLWIPDEALRGSPNAVLNRAGRTVINFTNGMLDATTMTIRNHDPKLRMINQVPHLWDPTRQSDDSVVLDFLKGVIPDPDDLEMFLEYVGYAMTTDTRLQKFLIICGEGGTGKSVLLRMVQAAIGAANCSGLTLQNLNDRFSPAFLFGMLANIYADLPSSDIPESNGIKTATGEDVVRGEFKGGALFNFRSYARLFFSCNKIPRSRDDQTGAYYRRLLILTINNRGPEIANLEERLEANVDDFVQLAVEAVHRMYADRGGKILESQNSKDAVEELYASTDTVKAWMREENVIKSPDVPSIARIERGELYREYVQFCADEGRPFLSRNGFFSNLREKGFTERKIKGKRYFVDLELRGDVDELSAPTSFEEWKAAHNV